MGAMERRPFLKLLSAAGVTTAVGGIGTLVEAQTRGRGRGGGSNQQVAKSRELIVATLPVTGLSFFRNALGNASSARIETVSISDVSIDDSILHFAMDRHFSAPLDHPEAEKTTLEKYDVALRDVQLPISVGPMTNDADHRRVGMTVNLTKPTTVSTTADFGEEHVSTIAIVVKDQNTGKELARALAIVVKASKAAG